MAKERVSYLCGTCGATHPKWMGKCPDCGAWDSLQRFVEAKPTPGMLPTGEHAGSDSASEAQPLGEIQASLIPRIASGVAEFDRVLGGGFVPGSVVLLGGDPGIGKSTLLLQALAALADGGSTVLYASSEESAHQLRLRAERLETALPATIAADESKHSAHNRGSRNERRETHLWIHAESNLARIIEQARKLNPTVLVVDSIQLVHRVDVDAIPGSVSQLRRCALDLVALAKSSGIIVVIVGHVTKDGLLAGPRLLEHLVDVVLSFEGDRHYAHRVVRAAKNRFGSTLEVGLFEMTSLGLRQVDESALAADPSLAPRPGSVAVPTMAGTRCLLAEVQALTATGLVGAAKRKASGLDSSRLAMLIAVLEQHGGLRLGDQDVYAAAAGGLKVLEPGADLAIALAVAGARLGRAVPDGFAAIGEISLSGQLRPCTQMHERIAAASRRGVTRIAVPASQKIQAPKSMEIVSIEHVSAAFELLNPSQPGSGRAKTAKSGVAH
ncbi:MAG: DNA repair protein RadA [Planctomycetes bacterium]|nr:DNA repair protein RadA [Planctomycetota bacterium]